MDAMTPKSVDCKLDTWQISQLLDRENIIIPRYQRSLVWGKMKQQELINSIKKGYPFGVLLLYEIGERDGKQQYQLIDGLQRTFAIREYMANQNQFFEPEEVDSDLSTIIVEELGVTGADSRDRVVRELTNWVHSRRGFRLTDGWDVSDLAARLVSRLVVADERSDEYRSAYFEIMHGNVLKNRLAHFLETVESSADISQTQLPVLLYRGEREHLPNIFELLNSRGVALSRYEIYAAKWIGHEQSIENGKIRDAIHRKYQALANEGFAVEAISSVDDEENEEDYRYTLFEFLFGFGQVLSDEYPRLFKPVSPDTPSSAGFNLVTASLGLRIGEMEDLGEELTQRGLDINYVGTRILDSTLSVDNCLRPISSINQRSVPVIHHTEFQIVSFIASLFQVRHDVKSLDELLHWKINLDAMTKKIPMFYLYDIVRDYWRGTGDAKLFENLSEQRYSRRAPTITQWQQVFDTWFTEDQITARQRGRYIREASPQLLLLKYIYTRKFTVYQNSETHHVEHVIPVRQLSALLKDDLEGLPINCVSNLALLESRQNLRKGDATFLEFQDDLLRNGKITRQERDDQLKRDEEVLLCPARILPVPLNQQSYETFLHQRFRHLVQLFQELWQEHIPNSPTHSD